MTSNEKMIYAALLKEHPGALTEISQLSYNDSGARNFVLSTEKGLNYDKVENCSSAYAEHNKERSPDALFLANDKLYFIEFKEGKHEKSDIRLKIHEGITTLFMFTKKHVPTITKKDFVDLDINYAIVARPPKHIGSSFQAAMLDTSKKYQLKNLEGFLVRKTAFASSPSSILTILKAATEQRLASIDIDDGTGNIQTYS